MNGPADLGGRHGFGPVRPEPDEPAFHADWERIAFALTLAMGASGPWTLDRSRYVRESLPPARYYAASYYEIWFAALERLVAECGVLAEDARPVARLERDAVRARMAAGTPTERPGPAPVFAPGQRVTVRPARPETHTRVPSYVRGRAGTVTAVHGAFVFPDTNAHGGGESPVPLYTVAFAARDLWGEDTTADEVRLDLFEPYLAAAAEPA